MKTNRDITQIDNRHFFHPWEYVQPHGNVQRTIIDKGEGVYIFDAEGNRYLDAPAGMWAVQVGHNSKRMADAIYDQIMNLGYYSPFNNTNSQAAILAERLASLAPGDCNQVMFTTGGSTAVECAIRLVHYYNNIKKRPNKKIILTRQLAFHGSTYLTSSLCGKERDTAHFDFATNLRHMLPHINPYRRPKGQTIEQFCDDKVADFQRAIDTLGADNIAAFIGEPIQASGGVIVPPPGYLKRVWEICKANDILFIADEVVTGFGRLGHWFAIKDVFGVEPDMITMAKGLTSGYIPMGAMIVSDRLMKEIQTASEDPNDILSLGYTYSGHPVGVRAAMASMDIIEQDKLLEHVREISPYFQQRLQDLRDIPLVGDVRGMGLMACIETKSEMETGESLRMDKNVGNLIDEHCQKMGLLVRPLINSCVMSPPLIITKAQIDFMVDTLRKGITLAMQDVIKQGYGDILK